MAIKNIIAKGIGFSPGGVKFIVTHGFNIGVSVQWLAAQSASGAWKSTQAAGGDFKAVQSVSGSWVKIGTESDNP